MGEKDSDFGVFLSGFMIGGFVGAAVALLLAPQSGEETRTFIKEKSIELKDKTTETAEQARIRAEKLAEEAKSRAAIITEQTKEKTAEWKQKGQVVLEDQKTKLQEAIETGKKITSRKQKKEENEIAEETSTGETKEEE